MFDFSLNPMLFFPHIVQAFQSHVIIITQDLSQFSNPVNFSFEDIGQEMWKCISLGPEQCGHEGGC